MKSKTGNLTILEALKLDLSSNSAYTKCKNLLKSNFRGAVTVKIADFDTQDLLKLISCKIWVAGKLLDFHAVAMLHMHLHLS